ncbi:EAL domain-containing protein [Pseudoduganella sp. FT25W]|uniref:EAL domain-containing protein n=1 Tax=Duganella alba TaxID=2666081 RepID=A0A6L5QMP5_9BURK|nr:GGDEF domain-containing protein [Duganella alba]MRX10959.1 EAL domain-containing protein [Duganella alba]MRX19081.1 EAL domain-containing protein [Duganella alba]
MDTSELPAQEAEQRRLAELSRYAITLDEPDPKLDLITSLAIKSVGADIGGISIVYQSQIWLPSRVGMEARHVPRSGSFCTWVVGAATESDFFEVEDAGDDARFCHNPLVTHAPHYRHYAAVPLHGARGYLLGTLWVMSRAVRRLDAEQQMMLQGMARLVVDTLELRYCDEVTGMSNRHVFLHHLQLGLEQTAQPHLVVGYIDLAGFRQFNDVFGREQGDLVLREIGQRIAIWAGPENLVGHLGGDQFAFALFGARDRQVQLLEALKAVISRPLGLGRGGTQVLHGRVGIAHHALPYSGSAVALLDAADTASSSIGGPLQRTALKEYGAELLTRSRMVFELQGALDGERQYGALVAHYQPQVDHLRGVLIGLEALVRWQHPARGMVFPNSFIPLAESTDKIYQLDMLVLEQVCRDMRAWLDQGLPVVPVALNFSRRSLLHPQVIADLRQLLARYGIDGGMLEFEVTESQLLATADLVGPRVAEFRALGARIAVDDFGTGYSNLDAISSFPFDRLKVDRQFVHGVEGSERVAGLFHLIQGIAELFKAELLCEGLEDEADLLWLARRGASCVQGWYFSAARTPEAIVRILGALRERATAPPLTTAQLRALLQS